MTVGRSSSAPRSIALFGLFGSGNTGNDASLEAMLALLGRTRPDARLLCVCGEPQRVGPEFAVPAVPMNVDGGRGRLLRKAANFWHALRQMGGRDLLIVPGTGALDDFGTGPAGLPLTLFTWCLAARLRGAAVAFVSIGAGPIHNPLSRWLMKSAVRMGAYRSYRDEGSKAFLQGLGVDVAADAVYPDLAFFLPASGAAPRQRTAGAPLDVGIGVMTYRGWDNDRTAGAAIYDAYLGKLTAFVAWLLEGGHRVRLLMGDGTDQRAGEDLLRGVRARLPAPSGDRIEARPSRTLHHLMAEIAKTDVVVATRFHSVIAALMLGRPVISIGYAQKNDELMADAGLGGFCQGIETLDFDGLIRQFTDLAAGLAHWQQRIADVPSRYRMRLRQQEAALASRLLSPRPSPPCRGPAATASP